MASILVVDDDPDLLRLVERRMQRAGHDVETATDGVDALAAIRSAAFDLVVLDWMMPRKSGLEVASELAGDPPPHGMPRILMLTARAQEHDVARALAAGARDYLTKPFSSVELTARVASLLRS